jgi:diguanylate cyclase (GGDEF)-like protein
MIHPFGSARRRLLLLIAPLLAVVTSLLVLVSASMDTLSAGRAYVGGEGLWSKAQKDAVHFLLRYARTQEKSDYDQYLASIAVPLGDRKAREALDRPTPDYAAARAGLIQGRNHVDDVDAMAALFVRFRHVSYVARAIDIWARADGEIEKLQAAATRLHAEIQGPRDRQRMDATLEEIYSINRLLSPMEDDFSFTLGEASRWMRNSLLLVLVAAAVLLVAIGTLRTRALLRRADQAEAARRESDERLIAQERRAARELEQVNEQLQFLAHHDALTTLPNRAMLQRQMQQAISLAKRHGRGLALLFVDLDRFKDVNDSLGHGVGDALLRAVGERMLKTVRNEDLVARLGGDEFCVLLQDIGEPREAGVVAQKMIAELSEPWRVSGHDLYVAASIGIACMPQDGYDVDTLLRSADDAMYRAKEIGRGSFQFFSSGANRGAMSAVALASSLRRALANGEFALYYEPRIDTQSGQLVAVEALLRWRHPERGLLLPEHFLRFAEDSGLILPIGDWVLREACAQARRWAEIGFPIAVSVNLSMRQLRNPDLPSQVRAALEGNALPPERLELEITESMAVQAPELVERSLRALSELGVRVSLDDFGTGHSALHYLKRFAINVLKIDQSFTAGLPADRYDAAIVRAIADLARGLELDVVAEGVRTRAQREFLLGIGCSACQGELFGAPCPAEDIRRQFLTERAA